MKNYSKKDLQSMSDWELVQIYCDEMGGIDENDLMIEVRGNKQERENLIFQLLQRMKPKYAKGSTVNVDDIKQIMYSWFNAWLNNYISDEELVNSLKRKLI